MEAETLKYMHSTETLNMQHNANPKKKPVSKKTQSACSSIPEKTQAQSLAKALENAAQEQTKTLNV
jgi:hypothetical protein